MWRGNRVFMVGLALFAVAAMLFGGPAAAQLVTSEPAAGLDNIPPAPVGTVSAEIDKDTPSVTLSWGLSIDDFVRQTAVGGDFTSGGTYIEVNDVAGYVVMRTDAGGNAVYLDTLASGSTSYMDDTVEKGGSYQYAVMAMDASGLMSTDMMADADIPRPAKLVRLTIQTATSLSDLSSEERNELIAQLRSQLAAAAGTDEANINITGLADGSIIIEFEIIDDDDPTTPTAEDGLNTLTQNLQADPAGFASTLESNTALASVEDPVAVEVVQRTGARVDLGDIIQGNTASETITLTNDSTGDQTITIQVTGDGFAVSATELSIAAGASGSFDVTFDAAAVSDVVGSYSGSLEIRTDEPPVIETRNLSAAVVEPPPIPAAIELSAASISFFQVLLDSTATSTVTITNTGEEALTGSTTLTGDAAFTAADQTFSLDEGETLDITVTFMPTEEIDYTATLTIASNDADDPSIDVAITGSGTAELAVLLPGDFDGDDTVGFSDFFLFADNFGLTSTSPDFNALFDLDESNDVGFSDFFLFADAFGTSLVDGQIVR